MRKNEFIQLIREKFPEVKTDRDLALDIANAMYDADNASRANIGSFEHKGEVYFVEARWYDGCLAGSECCPATCYTKWSLH